MLFRRGAPLSFVLIAVAVGCASPQVMPEASREELPPTPAADAGISYDDWKQPHPAPKTADEARAQRAEIERRPPDVRFIRAIDVVDRVFSPGTVGAAQVRFSGGKWFVVRSERTLAVLSQWPTFAELFAAVTASAPIRKSEADPGPARVVLSGAELWKELDALNVDWAKGDRSPAMLRRSAHALICLANEMHDAFGIGDVVWTRAIAFAGAAKAAGALTTEDEALLAQGMGYLLEARALASALPLDHPVRAYVQGDASALLSRAVQPNATAGDWYLAARSAAEKLEPAEVLTLVKLIPKERRTAALLHAFLRNDSFDVQSVLGADALGEDLLTLSRRVPMAPSTSALTVIIENALAQVKERQDAPFDSATERRVWRANVISAVRVMLAARQKQGGMSPEIAERFLTMLGTPPPGTMTDVVEWFRNELYAPTSDNQDQRWTAAERGIPALGAEAVASYAEMLTRSMPVQPLTIAQARAVARRMDSRPAHLRTLYRLVEHLTYDRGWQRVVAAAIVAETGDVDKRDWLLTVTRDWAALERNIHDPSLTPMERVRAVTTLEKVKQLETDSAVRLLNGIWQSSEDDAAATARFGFWLAFRKRWGDMLFLEQWLSRHEQEHTLHAATMRSLLALALRKLGRPDDAWRVLEPALDLGAPAAIREAAFLKLEEGDLDEAKQFDRALLKTSSVEGSLKFRWWSRDYAGAARRMAELSGNWQPEAAFAFIDAFEGKSGKEAQAAIAPVVKSLSSQLLIIWAENLRVLERVDYAAMVVEHLDVSNDLALALRGYQIVRAARGAPAADAWFARQKFTSRAGSILRAYDDGLAEALADPPASLTEIDDRIAVAEAAALAAERKLSGPSAEQLRQRVAAAPKSGQWTVAGAILNGGSPEGANNAASEALVTAARAEAERRVWDAIAGYQDVVDLGGPAGPDTAWSLARMYRIATELNPDEEENPLTP